MSTTQTPAQTREFAGYYDQFYPAVFKYMRYRGADVDTAQDLAGLVFERALRSLASYNPERGTFRAWLFAVAHNTAANHWRAASRQAVLSLDGAAEVKANTPGPEEAAVQRESRRLLLAALTNLDERERDLVGLKFAGSLTNRQIAALTGLGESHVGVILFRAVTKVRVFMQQKEEDPHA